MIVYQESVIRNSIFESNPTMIYNGKSKEQLMNLRPREQEKEIGPSSFKYANKTSLERVYDTLSNRNSFLLD